MTYSAFELEVVDGVGHVTLNQPDRGNPIDLTFTHEFNEIATELDEDPRVRSVLIDARGRYFSVGADLKSMVSGSAEDLPNFVKRGTSGAHMALSRLARMRAPVVVSVHALAVGGSVALCATADFCVAARTATFYAGYTGIGLVPDMGGSYYLPRRVGTRRATEFLMRNRTWTADQAAEYGLINDAFDDSELAAESWALARELAAGPTSAFGEIKNLLQSTYEQPVEAQMEYEARAMVRVTRGDDVWKAMNAVLAKQKPTFTGH
jgi:2-(1,2-epoxy-1,2-dihydrophenyl)acetyl-CoA isomerase